VTGTGLFLAFGTGFLGGFGHCVGMCGPLLLAFGLAAPDAPARGLRPQLAYHAGRITTYGLVGAVMGLAGSFVNVAGRLAGFQDAVAVLAGALMVALGVGAAAATGGLRSLEGRLVGPVVRAARGLVEDAVGRAYPLGLVMGLLPCGLSYSAFAGAAATGGPAAGLLFTLAFGAGTLPALLAAGWAAGLLSARARGAVYRAGGVLVALIGVLFVLRGLHVHAPL